MLFRIKRDSLCTGRQLLLSFFLCLFNLLLDLFPRFRRRRGYSSYLGTFPSKTVLDMRYFFAKPTISWKKSDENYVTDPYRGPFRGSCIHLKNHDGV